MDKREHRKWLQYQISIAEEYLSPADKDRGKALCLGWELKRIGIAIKALTSADYMIAELEGEQ